MFSVGSTDVYLHLATVVFAAYMVLTGYGTLLVCGFASIILHEMGHAAVSAALGYPPQEVEITPLGCLMRQEQEAQMPLVKRLLMLFAGPCVTLLVCVASVLLAANGWVDRAWGRMAFTCNAAILCVNVLPALPLDGGRIVSLLLGCFLRQDAVRKAMKITGSVVGAVLIVLNAAVCLRFGGYNLSLACAGCFLMYAAVMCTTPTALSELQMLMERKTRLEGRGHQPMQLVAVVDTLPLRKAIRLLHPRRSTCFAVQKLGSMVFLSCITEDELVSAYLKTPGETCRIFAK